MTYKIHLPFISSHKFGLKQAFARHGIRFGFAVGSGSFRSQIKRQLIEQHASVVGMENALKMEYTQPQRGVYDFSEGDAIVAAAQELGIAVHGHAASWSLQNPQWLYDGNFSRDELSDILIKHVMKLGQHFWNQLVSLDTANEAYVAGGLNAGPWSPLGDDYVRISFEYANYYPMVYNSFFPGNNEYDKALGVLNKEWAEGIGIQLHLWDSSYRTQLARTEGFLERIRAAGYWCRFSELSVVAVNEQSQSDVYAAITKLAIKYKDIVKDVVVWGVKDPTWRSENAVLFDRAGNPKPAYYAVLEEL